MKTGTVQTLSSFLYLLLVWQLIGARIVPNAGYILGLLTE